jgi:molybdenum cofactor cytidylyltransferase
MKMSSGSARIGGIVLAAGESRRMGRNKLLLPLGGEPLVRRACRRGLAAGLDPLIVVLGHESERVREALTGLGCRFILNAEVGGPMSGSLHCGLKALPADAEGAVVMLADMVNVTEQMLRTILLSAQASPALLVCSRYAGTLAPPVLFRRALFDELYAASGEHCGRAVVEHHREHAIYVDWPGAALVDVDTPEEFASL